MHKNIQNRMFHIIFQNFNQTIIRQIINLLLNFALIVLLARTLGPEGYGKYALVIFFPTLLSNLLNFGVRNFQYILFSFQQSFIYYSISHVFNIFLHILCFRNLCFYFISIQQFTGLFSRCSE